MRILNRFAKIITSSLFLLLGFIALSPLVSAADFNVPASTKILSSDGYAGDQFGISVRILGDYAIVGAEWDDDTVANSGSAYIFKRTAGVWNQIAKLNASDPGENDRFGHAVAISTNYAVVGAYGNSDAGSLSGSAYIFEKDLGGADNWGFRKKITASDAAWDDRFGTTVAAVGDYVFIGSPNNDNVTSNSADGSVYIYGKDTGGADNWGEIKELNASDAATNRQFGSNIIVSGDWLLVNAVGDGGQVYLFEKDYGGVGNWGEKHIFISSDRALYDAFGVGMAVQGNYIFLGAPYDDDTASASGSVYVFEKDLGGVDNWGERKKIVASDPEVSDYFGLSIAAGVDQIYVSSEGDDDGTSSGAAYVFKKDLGGTDNWGEWTKLTAEDGEAYNRFSEDLSLSGDDLIISARYDNIAVPNDHIGSAYILDVTTITLPPVAPTDFTGTSFNGSTATLEWTDNSTSETNFNIYYATSDSQPGVASYTPAANATSQAVTGLSSTLPNYFWLTAENGAGETAAQKICLMWAGGTNKARGCDTVNGDSFGTNVDYDGEYAVIGAIYDDDGGTSSGSAYVFRKNGDTWSQIKKLTASDANASDYFGSYVAISGNYVIVGAPGNDDGGTSSGSAYIFEKDYGGTENWGERKKLLANDDYSYDGFGYDVDISGTVAVVGASGNDDNGSASGSAYVFSKDQGGTDNWGEVKELHASDAASGDTFGESVAIDGNYIVVTADDNDDGAYNAGSAYIFEKDTGGADNWGEVKELHASDPAASDRFGYSSAINGNYIVVGTYDANAVYIFEKDYGGADNWGQRKILLGKDTVTNDEFGYRVGIDGNYVVVGAWSDDDQYSNAGSVWVFEKDEGGTDNWGVYAKVLASDATYEQFGVSVSMSGNTFFAGANGDDDLGSGYSMDVTTFTAPNAPSDIYISSYAGSYGTANWTDNASDEYNYYIYRSNTTTKPDQPVYYPAANSTSNFVSGLSTTLPNYIWVTAIGERETTNDPVCIKYSSVEGKILPCDGAADDHFGQIIDISGNYAVVGAPDDDDNGSASGSAYIFRRSGTSWTRIKKLSPSDSAAGYNFGKSVTIDGNYVVVGSDNADGSGMAFVFEKDYGGTGNWGERKKLVASDAAASDSFGETLNLSGNYAIIGASANDDAGADSGSAYIFEKDFGGADNWGERKKLVAGDAAAGDTFGLEVVIDGTTAVVGAPSDDDNGSGSGSAYVFTKDTGGADNWGQVKKITASDGAASDAFASSDSLGIDGNYIVAGSSVHGGNGAAYLYEKDYGGVDNWGERKIITASDAAAGDLFGKGVAVEGTSVLVGASADDDNGADSGSFYIFEKDTGGADNWGQLGKVSSSDGAASDNFGASIALESSYIVVGAEFDDDNGSASGSAYSYDLTAFAPPTAPSSVYASDFDGSTATLNWTDNSSDEDNFNIYYATTNVQPGSPTYTPAANATSQALAGLSNTLPNYLWLSAENSFGESSVLSVCLRYSSVSDKIIPCDGQADDYFGHAVDIQGNYAVVGAWQDDDNGSDAGAAYVFRRSGTTWTQIKKLVGSDTSGSDNFGTSVSVLYDRIFVGAPGVDDVGSDSGAVYVFSQNQGGSENWGQVKKITASDQTSGDRFGESLSSVWDDGTYKLVIGAPNNDDGGADSGSVYFHSQNTGGAENWGEIQKVVASNAAAGDNYGKSVDMSTTHAVVGAWQTDGAGVNSGSAYVLVDSLGWTEVTEITASDAAASDNFGNSVSIYNNSHVIVGAPYHNSAEGAAYIYGKDQGGADNWGEVKKLVATDAAGGDRLGWSVTTQTQYAIVGAYLSDENGVDSGAAYLFKQNEGGTDNWGQVEKINPSDNAADDYFGVAASLSGTDLIVGAQKDDEDASNSGSAYVYDVSTIGATPKVYDSIGTTNEDFGFSVDIDADLAIVGKPNYNTFAAGDAFIYKKNATTGVWEEKWNLPGLAGELLGTGVGISGEYAAIGSAGFNGNTGNVKIYKRVTDTNWTLVDTLTASDAASRDTFGWSVSIKDDYLAIGAPGLAGAGQGKAYVFQRDTGLDTWSEIAALTASDAAAGQTYGISVSIDSSDVVIGASYEYGDGSGAAYFYNKDQGGADNWGEVQKVTANNLGRADYFGKSVAINGSYTAIGAPKYDNANDNGRVHIFKNTAGVWAESDTFQAGDTAGGYEFGSAVDILGNYVVVGAQGADGIASNGEGKAYLFERDSGLETWSENQTFTASDGLNKDALGSSIAFAETSNEYDIIVGAKVADGAASNTGAAYFFSFTGTAPTTPPSGDGGGNTSPHCTVNAPQFNLPHTLEVIQEGGEPAVLLTWKNTRILDSLASGKTQVLLDYLDQSPMPQLDGTDKSLQSIFARYMYSQIYSSGDSALIQAFEKKLKAVTDEGEAATTNILKTLGISERNSYFSEWWAYLIVDKLKNSQPAANTFMSGVSDTFENSQFTYSSLLRNLFTAFVDIEKSPQELKVAQCIDDAVAGHTLEDFIPGQLDSVYGKQDDELEKLYLKMKQEGVITALLNSLKNDKAFIENTNSSLNISMSALLFSWANNANVQKIIEFYQNDPTFNQFRNVLFQTDVVQEMEACAKAVYKKDLIGSVSKLKAEVVQGVIESGAICNEDVSAVILEALTELKNEPKAQVQIESMMLEFINELLSTEKQLTEYTGYQDAFTKYFNQNYSLPSDRTYDDITLEIYREGELIHSEENPTYSSYLDETVPVNDSSRVKQYKYYLKTKTQCEDRQGSTGIASINPQLKEGTAIDVYADIKIKIKDGFDVLFAEKLEALVQAAKTNNLGGNTGGGQGGNGSTTFTCNEAEKALSEPGLTSEKVMNYILACHGNSTINPLLKEKRTKILPPLMLLLKLNTTEEEKVIIGTYIQPIIVELGEQLNKAEEVFSLAIGELAKIDSSKKMTEFTDEEKQTILCAGIPNCDDDIKNKVETYFKGNAHAADLIVDVYDENDNKVYQATGQTNIFGEIDNLYLGQFLSGSEYTIKIRLSGQRFVLPKLSVVTLNTAEPQTGGGFRADLDLSYSRQFRYGNFDESNDIIDLNDIVEWGRLISEQPELYDHSNLDGLEGIDLLDAVTFQQNWGEVQESRVEGSQITLEELAKIFGFSSLLQTKIQAPSWLKLLEISCNI